MIAPSSAAPAPASASLLTWTKLAPGVAPPVRIDAAMAFDAATNTTVLFGGLGGSSGTTILGDTWVFDGTTWTQATPKSSPPPLSSATMAYDSVNHVLLLFGGQGTGGAVSGESWSWDGTTWTQLTVQEPPARYAASMAADSLTGTDMMFGGISALGIPMADTWIWNGTIWTPLAQSSAPVPEARSGAAMTFDSARGVVVLFGGTTVGPQADTWTFDGTTWAEQAPDTSPPPRSAAAFGFDLGSANAVLFGGLGGNSGTSTLGDTWLWNGSTWTTSLPLDQVPSLSPPARSQASMATEPTSGRLILFGGSSGTHSAPNAGALDDTWAVSTVQSIPSATTTTVVGGSTSTSAPTTSTTRPRSSQVPTSTTVPPTPVPPPTPSLLVNATTVRRGDDVRVSGGGFVPYARVTISLHTAAMVVGTTYADADGHFALDITVPNDAPTGAHQLEATGPAMQGGQGAAGVALSIIAPGGGNHWLLPLLMVLLTLVLAAVAGGVLLASTRWRRPTTT